jgi:hypothetical protein
MTPELFFCFAEILVRNRVEGVISTCMVCS